MCKNGLNRQSEPKPLSKTPSKPLSLRKTMLLRRDICLSVTVYPEENKPTCARKLHREVAYVYGYTEYFAKFFLKNTARRRDVTTNAFAKPRRTASRRCSEALYLLSAPPLFNVNYFINPPLAPFACNNSLYVSLLWLHSVSCVLHPASRVLWTVFCVLHPASRVLWTVFCVLRPASGFTPCASRSYLLCPLIIAQRPLCIAPSCRLCICCTFSVITISYILPQSNSESRSHVSCPALRILCPASCFAPDYALCSLCSYQHCPLSLAPRPCPSPPLYHLLHRATLLRYNFGLSCRAVIPSTAPRLFRRYSLEYNRPKVP